MFSISAFTVPQGNGGRNVRQYSTPMRTLMNTERLRIQWGIQVWPERLCMHSSSEEEEQNLNSVSRPVYLVFERTQSDYIHFFSLRFTSGIHLASFWFSSLYILNLWLSAASCWKSMEACGCKCMLHPAPTTHIHKMYINACSDGNNPWGLLS